MVSENLQIPDVPTGSVNPWTPTNTSVNRLDEAMNSETPLRAGIRL